jgi:transposase, IS5 family
VKLQAYQDELDRIPIEGKFGQGKRRFSLARVMSKLAQTSETAIMVAFLVMNLEKWLQSLLFCLFLVFQGCLLRLRALIKSNLIDQKGTSQYRMDATSCV